MARLLLLLIALLTCVEARAVDGRYRIEGVGSDATGYTGSARVRTVDGEVRVGFRTFEGGVERRAAGVAHRRGEGLVVSLRFDADFYVGAEPRLIARLEPLAGSGGFKVTYGRPGGPPLRHEVWTRDPALARIPVVVVALTGDEELPGVSPAQAHAAQRWIVAQLGAVFEPLGIAFHAIHREPPRLSAAPFDRDRDGSFSRDEVRALRSAFEERGHKRPGRVVVAVTAADFVHGQCRGWTLGDAPVTPDTLTDPNDNFSLVGLRYLDPSEFHTVAHEVGHQLGLDDIRPANRDRLDQPDRADHLMISGGTGLFVDVRIARLLRRGVARFPEHGLEGRRGQRLPIAPATSPPDSGGLPDPPLLPR